MSTLEKFQVYTAKQIAEEVGIFSESELKRMASRQEIQHTRGARNKILFTETDIRALLRQFRQTPTKQPAELAPVPALAEPTPSPFRTTPRSRAAHKETARRSA